MDNIDESIDAEIEAQTEAEITRLAGLPVVKYEQERNAAAKKLDVRASVLDKLVKQARMDKELDESHDELTAAVEPWDSPVDGSAVALEIMDLLKRHTILPKMGYEAITLWSIGTYVYDAFRIYPRLCLHSPQKRCGKTTTLEIIEALSHRVLIASNVSASVIFRAIEAWHPTILADEADTWIHGNEELRGIINSGHTRRSAQVLRVEEVGGERVPKKFSTWAPMAIAMIKTPPDTIMDRSVVVNLRRRTRQERVHKIPASLFDDQLHIRRKLKRWSLDNMAALRSAQPDMPDIPNDRAEDNWFSLVAVAEALGGDWSQTAIHALKILEGAKPEDEDIGAMLLEDIREVFSKWKHDNIFSEVLVEMLVDMESRPWCEWRRGNPMTKNSLSRLLKPYNIRPKTVRIGGGTQKGYPVSDFLEPFSRYIPDLPDSSVTTSQANGGAAPERDTSEPQNVTVTVETSHETESVTPEPSSDAGCDDVTDENPKYGGDHVPPPVEDFG